MALRTITLRGFKSIASLENFEMRNINLLIGANGSGKSNFLSAFKFLAKVAQGNLQNYVMKEGGPDVFLHGGRKRTQIISIEFDFNNSNGSVAYVTEIEISKSNSLNIKSETILDSAGRKLVVGANDAESTALSFVQNSNIVINPELGNIVIGAIGGIQNIRQYHFHDTGDFSPMKGVCSVDDNIVLKEDGQNISAYLRELGKSHPHCYRSIVETIRMVAPFFGDFIVRNGAAQAVQLEWYERGDPDTPYNAHVLSDGTLRFICLTTLLLQPSELLPDTIIIDEPELGLHPYAISLLAEMIKQVAETKQVVIATQSVELLNHFAPEDVVVADREGPATVLRRLNADDLSEWLKSYSLGELWQKNVLGGRPV